MKCRKCRKKSVFEDLCKDHFIDHFEKKIKKTIKDFRLIDKEEKILVAASGGKDSLTTLYLLQKLGYNPDALLINEGISGYREHSLNDLERFCQEHGINLKIVSFKDEFGYELDQIVKKIKDIPCTPCGILRRYLLNKYAKGYDKIATGHNLDDETQAFLMNIMKNNLHLIAKQGPLVGVKGFDGFTRRIKPMIRCSEKEVRIYTLLKGFDMSFSECPYVRDSYRDNIRTFLNDYENKNKGTKQTLLQNLLTMLPSLKKEYQTMESLKQCPECGEPSRHGICSACELLNRINSTNKNRKTKK